MRGPTAPRLEPLSPRHDGAAADELHEEPQVPEHAPAALDGVQRDAHEREKPLVRRPAVTAGPVIGERRMPAGDREERVPGDVVLPEYFVRERVLHLAEPVLRPPPRGQ